MLSDPALGRHASARSVGTGRRARHVGTGDAGLQLPGRRMACRPPAPRSARRTEIACGGQTDHAVAAPGAGASGIPISGSAPGGRNVPPLHHASLGALDSAFRMQSADHVAEKIPLVADRVGQGPPCRKLPDASPSPRCRRKAESTGTAWTVGWVSCAQRGLAHPSRQRRTASQRGAADLCRADAHPASRRRGAGRTVERRWTGSRGQVDKGLERDLLKGLGARSGRIGCGDLRVEGQRRRALACGSRPRRPAPPGDW